ncbi:MAG: tRNA(Met) cytidine acetyltransferase [Candidatus Altiarchaeota archaeon]|nr:tRNA(Met) cytidine acetyltransferase [Candidatus Altiarchaeota archaeon]
MFSTVLEQAKASNQRRMMVTDDISDVFSWSAGLSGLHVGWDKLKLKDFKFMAFSDTDKVLGKTYDNLVLDLRGSFSANDIAKVIPCVRGGGVIILITPSFEVWATSKLKYHERLTSPPFKLEDSRSIFIPRIIRKLYEFEGIWIKKDGNYEKESLELPMPKEHVVNKKRKIHELAKSQGQIDFLDKFKEGVSVLLANRGRGKSAALGLLIADLRHKRDSKTEVVVVAPNKDKVKTVFEFLEKALDHLGIPYGYKNEILLGKKIKVVFEEPESAISRKADLFVVDEAASIPFSILSELAKKDNVVFSTTVHGYEGSGRIFSLIFLKSLSERGYNLVTMDQPIRYAQDDPIEKWLFSTFLLDAEPKKSELKKLKFNSPTIKKIFSDEDVLKEVFGLLISAHYKNTPNDLQILADAPHHKVNLIESKGLLGVIQTAFEGGLTNEKINEMCEKRRPEGNLIPDTLCKHYGLKDFSKLRGLRVVRIVSHPRFQGKGVGSFGLKNLKGEDWIGASFGASKNLIKFWTKNEFIPLALGPYKNPITGEYAVIVVKPISDSANLLVKKLKEQFELRFLGSLGDVYWDLNPKTVREILKTFSGQIKPKFSILELARLNLFLEGKHVYEFDVDILTKLVKWYFGSELKYLSEAEELVLISKVLQGAMWKIVKEKTGSDKVFETIKTAISKIAKNLSA